MNQIATAAQLSHLKLCTWILNKVRAEMADDQELFRSAYRAVRYAQKEVASATPSPQGTAALAEAGEALNAADDAFKERYGDWPE